MLKSGDGISTDLRSKLRRLEEVSWNFDRARSRSAFSSIHFHPGRFISQLPSILISLFSEPGDTVFDPFCGSGTTLVEAQRLSRNSIGIDVNPISVLISKGKTLPLLQAEVTRILRAYFVNFARGRENSRAFSAPATVQLKKWYSVSVARDLNWLFQNARFTTDDATRALKLFCFSCLLMKVTRETRHWGYICDNTNPKENPKRDVAEALEQTIEQIRFAYQERDKFIETETLAFSQVSLETAVNTACLIAQNSIDLVVTSPPYFGVVDYVKAQRLSMEWLEYDIEEFRGREIGARSKRHRKNAASEFESELSVAFSAVRVALKPGRLCAVIFGASEARSFREERLIPILQATGFEFVHDITRDISIQRRQKPSLLSERVYIFRKPMDSLIGEVPSGPG